MTVDGEEAVREPISVPHVPVRPVPVAPAVAAAALCAGLSGSGTFTMILAGLLTYMLSRRTPELALRRAIVMGLVVGIVAGVFDGAGELLGAFMRPDGGYDQYGGGSRLDEFLPHGEGASFGRALASCCNASFAHPIAGMAGAWFGRVIGPTSNKS